MGQKCPALGPKPGATHICYRFGWVAACELQRNIACLACSVHVLYNCTILSCLFLEDCLFGFYIIYITDYSSYSYKDLGIAVLYWHVLAFRLFRQYGMISLHFVGREFHQPGPKIWSLLVHERDHSMKAMLMSKVAYIGDSPWWTCRKCCVFASHDAVVGLGSWSFYVCAVCVLAIWTRS